MKHSYQMPQSRLLSAITINLKRDMVNLCLKFSLSDTKNVLIKKTGKDYSVLNSSNGKLRDLNTWFIDMV